MSLGIVVKGPEGIVLAAESRITVTAQTLQGPIHVNYDNAVKLFSFKNRDTNTDVGVVTYGQAAIGLRTAYSFTHEFEAKLPEARLPIKDFAARLGEFYLDQWNAVMPANYQGPSMIFVIAGFDEGEPYGRVFLLEIPTKPGPAEQQEGAGAFGITWGGQRDTVDRLIQGFDARFPEVLSQVLGLTTVQIQALAPLLAPLQMQIPLAAMPLQDCVDLAIFFIRTTISAQRLTVGIRGCGGPIDVATITGRDGLKFVQRKRIVGEIANLSANSKKGAIDTDGQEN